jgi:hypothetical protein
MNFSLWISGWFQALPPWQRQMAPYLLLALAIFAAYSNVYHNAFLYDDKTLITDNFFLTYAA